MSEVLIFLGIAGIVIGVGLACHQVILRPARERRRVGSNSIAPIQTGGVGTRVGALALAICLVALGFSLLYSAV